MHPWLVSSVMYCHMDCMSHMNAAGLDVQLKAVCTVKSVCESLLASLSVHISFNYFQFILSIYTQLQSELFHCIVHLFPFVWWAWVGIPQSTSYHYLIWTGWRACWLHHDISHQWEWQACWWWLYYGQPLTAIELSGSCDHAWTINKPFRHYTRIVKSACTY